MQTSAIYFCDSPFPVSLLRLVVLRRLVRGFEGMRNSEGLTETRRLTASLNVSGCKDTGLALGIIPPLRASGTARLYRSCTCWACGSAENVARVAFSASCHHVPEYIRVPAIVMPKRKLRQVQRQIFLAHLMVRAHDSTLQERRTNRCSRYGRSHARIRLGRVSRIYDCNSCPTTDSRNAHLLQ